MSSTSNHSPQNTENEAQEESSAANALWAAHSPLFDKLTMSAIVLDRLLQNIRFQDGPLYCLQSRGQVPGT